MRVVVVANGDVRPGALVERLQAGQVRPLVICADGGAEHARRAGVRPDLVIGDGDSLLPEQARALRRDGIDVRLVAAEKDESDTQLCLLEAVARGADAVVVLGALGGERVDHSLANVGLLALPDLAGMDVSIEHGPTTIRLIGAPDVAGQAVIDGSPGDLVSLLPVGDGVSGVTTTDLRYPLRDEPLPAGPARGLSNEMLGHRARVDVRAGRLLVIHTTRTALADPGTPAADAPPPANGPTEERP
jgi:thiamine pyrophosphokinase